MSPFDAVAGGLGVWMIVDLILIAAGSLRDAEDRRVYRWLEPAPASIYPAVVEPATPWRH